MEGIVLEKYSIEEDGNNSLENFSVEEDGMNSIENCCV